jgi:hypothetical protein
MAAKLTFDAQGNAIYPHDVAAILAGKADKFTREDVTGPNSNGWLREEAEAYARGYSGDFEYLVSMGEALTEYGGLTVAQCVGVLNCMRADYNKKHASTNTTRAAVTPVVSDGKYTIVHDNGNWSTLSVETIDDDERAHMAQRGFDVPKNTQRISYLFGRDNTSDYTGCAFLFGNRVQMFKKHANANNLRRACEYIANTTLENRHALGVAYARMSGSCYVCGRTLTTPESIAAGIGPICAGRVGV